MNYTEELKIYTQEFYRKLRESFEMTNSAIFVKIETNKINTQFGYKVEETQRQYRGEHFKLKEFPFKWGFNDEIQMDDHFMFSSGAEEFYVPNKDKMESIVKETITNQDSFFDAIIAKLLLQDFFAVQNCPPEHTSQRVVRLQPTVVNSSKFGSIDYIEYIFILTVFKDNN